MLTLWDRSSHRTCEGTSRRDFLKVGSLGAGSFALPHLLRARAEAAENPPANRRDTSIVWLWLGGGPTHIETFDPKMDAPSEYRSTVGAVDTVVPGIQIGGLFPEMAKVADEMVFVRSFAHGNSGHSGGTHWVMTGYNFPPADQGQPPVNPSHGSILSRVRGANHPQTGIPTYVRINGIYADGPAWLGSSNAPFDSGGEARGNMQMKVTLDRLSDRRGLLDDLDRINRGVDRSGLMTGLDDFEGQAFNLVLGEAKEAFDIKKEDPRVRERYGPGLGEQMLLARRLCEAGCGMVNIHYGGWDMHGNIANAMRGRCPQMDRAVSAFISDVVERGQRDNIMLVITGEFGRTPRVNGTAGRDHWAPLTTLALACGGLKTGCVVGQSSAKAEVPNSAPVTPQDLMATVFHHLGIPQDTYFVSPAGRPTPMITGGRPIAEIV